MKEDPIIKAYLIRAIYDWCYDAAKTPYIVCFVNEHTRVPKQFVRDNQIVLNIGIHACEALKIGNQWIEFKARFSGVAFDVAIPLGHVIGIFAHEDPSQGLGFELEKFEPAINKPVSSNIDPLLDDEAEKPIARSGHLKLHRKK